MSNAQNNTLNDLTLAQKILGLANLGMLASDTLIPAARTRLEKLHEAGQCVAPEAIKALSALEIRALPSQALCKAGMAEIGDRLKPLMQEARAARRAAQVEVNRERPRG